MTYPTRRTLVVGDGSSDDDDDDDPPSMMEMERLGGDHQLRAAPRLRRTWVLE